MKSWLVKVRMPDKAHLWFGNFQAPGRNEAKREARLFVAKHFPDTVMILAIAEGHVEITFDGPEIPFDS